jgi:hypothetical protein
MNAEERVHTISAAIADSERANSPEECDRLECVAIAEWLRIARETGLDATLLKRGMREANNAKLMPAPVELNHLGEPDFGKGNDERAWLWAVLATFLNDLRVGFFRTKGGKIIIHAAKSMSDGTGSLFSKAPTRQGVDPDSEDREAFYFSVVSFAAAYDARNNCGKRVAIHVAAGEYGMNGVGISRPISPETLRQRVNHPDDKLAKHYDILFRELRKSGRLKAVLQAHEDLATIDVKTSPYEAD